MKHKIRSHIQEKLKNFLIEHKKDLDYANIAKIFNSETGKGIVKNVLDNREIDNTVKEKLREVLGLPAK